MNYDRLLRIKDFITPIARKKNKNIILPIYRQNNRYLKSFLNNKPYCKNRAFCFRERFVKTVVLGWPITRFTPERGKRCFVVPCLPPSRVSLVAYKTSFCMAYAPSCPVRAHTASTRVFWYSISKTNYTIVRPLIDFSRCKITMACTLFFLPVYPDLSNLKTRYSRNRIRKQIIPTIQFFFNPKAEKALFQFSEFYNRDILGF